MIEDTLNGAARVQQHAKENPILNNPYSEPSLHYSTNDAGELDYQSLFEGRRPFVPDIPPVPVKQGPQKSLIGLDASVPSLSEPFDQPFARRGRKLASRGLPGDDPYHPGASDLLV